MGKEMHLYNENLNDDNAFKTKVDYMFYLRILLCSNDFALPMPAAPPPIVIASFIIFKEQR